MARPRRPPAATRALVAGETFDLDFRPASYWDDVDPVAAILRDIKGERRREAVAEALRAGLPDVPDEMLASALSRGLRTAVSHVHPTCMGGEYLPDLGPGWTEIARVVLASTTMDVYSLRARRVSRGTKAGRLCFHMVDEYKTEYTIAPRSSSRPLSLGDLIHLIDTVDEDGSEPRHPNYILNICAWQIDGSGSPEDAYRATQFVSVESIVYPQLGDYYEALQREWAESKGVVWAFDGIRWVMDAGAMGLETADEQEQDEKEPWQ